MATYIDKIGVELELGVKTNENSNTPSVTAFDVTSDGSIHVTPSERSDGFTAAEYVSKPIEYSSNWDSEEMSELESGIHALYRNHDAICNSSMGMHVHVSFNKDYFYHALASMKFYEFFMERVRDSRLYDQYKPLRVRCQGVDYAKQISGHQEIQDTMTGGRKYRHFTYRSGRKTVEFRLMPAFESKRQVMDAIELITSSVNAFLFNKEHEFEEEDKVSFESDDVIEDDDVSRESVQEVVEYV